MFSLIFTAGIIGAAYAISKAASLGGGKPTKGKTKSDIMKMRTQVNALSQALIPITEKELELLSYDDTDETYKKSFGTVTLSGIFLSIYQEHMVAYVYKGNTRKKRSGLLIVKTLNSEFLYQIVGDKVTVMMGEYLLGEYGTDGLLYGAKSGRLITRMNKDAKDFNSLIVMGEDKATIRVPSPEDINPRVFEFIDQNLTDDQLVLIQAVVYYELVDRVLKSKE